MLRLALTSAAFAALLSGTASADALRAFDVAEDLSRFTYAETHRHADGMPAYGNVFVTQGYIYPEGTLDGGVEGTLADGSPAFPDKVLGTWTCDGVFVGDGMYTETGTMLISRQIFEFANGDVIVTQGAELVDENVPVARVIAGGTGDYAGLGGVMNQTLLGMSDGFGVRLQLEIPGESHASVAPLGQGVVISAKNPTRTWEDQRPFTYID